VVLRGTVVVDTVVVLLAAVTATTDTVVCLLVAVVTLPLIRLATHTTDTGLILVADPSRLLPCAASPTIATVVEGARLPCATTLRVTETIFLPLPVAVLGWTTRLATSLLEVVPPVIILHLAATVTSRHLPPVVADTKTCPLPLPALVVRAAGTQTGPLVPVTTTLDLLLVATKMCRLTPVRLSALSPIML